MPEQKEDFSVANLLQAQRDLLLGPARNAGPGTSGPAAGSSANAEGDSDAFVNLKHYAYIVYGRKLWVLLVTALLAGTTALIWWSKTRNYEAEAQVVLEENIRPATGDLFGSRAFYFDTEALAKLGDLRDVRIAADKKVAAELESRLKQLKDAIARKEPGASLSKAEEETIKLWMTQGKGLEGEVRLKADKYTVKLYGTAKGKDQSAALLAGARVAAIAKALVEEFLASVGGGPRRDFIKQLLDKNETEFKKVSEYLLEVATSNISPGELPPDLSGKLDYIQAQKQAVIQTELRLSEARESAAQYRRLMGQPRKDDLALAPEIQGRLLQLNIELVQLEEHYNPGHPKVLRKQEEIDSIRKLIRDQATRPDLPSGSSTATLRAELFRSEAEICALEARKVALNKRIKEVADEVAKGKVPEAALEYESNVRQRRSLEEMSVFLRRKLREAEIMAEGYAGTGDGSGGRQPISIGSIGAARVVGVGFTQTIGFAIVLGLALGIILALLLEHLDDTVRSELSARKATNLPVISKLPLFTGAPDKLYVSPSEPRADVAETFKVFHNQLRYAAPNVPEKCLLLTSPGPEEGKSYVAVNLALSFASEGNRVCFIDADLRRSRTHERMEVLRPRGATDVGLCAYLEGTASYETAILATEHENLSVLLAGGRAANPPRILRSDRMRELLARADREFDVIIIDAPPVLPVVDAAILATLVRSVVVVVRFGWTHMADLHEAAERLMHVGAPAVGIVINGVHGSGAGYYYGYRYGYRYRYSYGYGYSSYGETKKT